MKQIFMIMCFDDECGCWRPLEKPVFTTIEAAQREKHAVAAKGWWREQDLKVSCFEVREA